MISGSLVAAKNMNPKIKVLGVEPYLARDAFDSMNKGSVQEQYEPVTIADGVRGQLGDKTFEIMMKYCDGIILVQEKEIEEAVNMIM